MDRMITMPKINAELWLRMPKPCHEKQQFVAGDSKKEMPPTDDFISQIPDHLLVHILSLLTMKEAGRTSILSKRWIRLWTHYPNLVFDAFKTLYSLEMVFRYGEEVEEKAAHDAARHDYLNWVNKVVTSHSGPTIDQFMVQFGLDQSYTNQINEWVQFAFQRSVQRFTLDLFAYSRAYLSSNDSRRYRFPASVMHQNRHRISRSLTSLRLIEVDVTCEILQWFLSSCPLLESVAVHFSATLLNLEAHTTTLKSLDFQYCANLASVVLIAPNLESFACTGGTKRDLILQLTGCTHKLTNMTLGGYFCHHVLQNPLEYYSYLSGIVALKLNVFDSEELVLNSQFPLLPRLKSLEVTVDSGGAGLLGFASLLKALPLLYEVTFMFNRIDEFVEPDQADMEELEIPICPHNSLKVVNLVGFVGDAIDVELAFYLMKNAVNLEKISFDTRSLHHTGTVVEFEEETEKREAARKRAQPLVTKLPPGVTSVII